ncbi:MAG TPA: HTH domain-containing protein, partial [Anaeromyxobacter sp.]|nr:HTH domain-containing protein [Anaeromyxobacter sp.]
MTFTEAALEVLRREGKPLHFTKITELAIRENLLDHVGKVPEETMADQLAAHARLPRTERRLLPVQSGTFGLVEWGLDEDPAGLENLVEPPADDLPLRGRERHPIPLRDLSRGGGRAEARGEGQRPRRREEEEHRGRRFPPPAEVAYEILAGAGRPLSLVEIAAQGAERLLMSDAFVRDTGSLRAALHEDNRRRESSGRKALFGLDGESVSLSAQPEPGEHAALPSPARAASAADLRRAALASIRRRLRECDGPTVEHIAVKLLERTGFREIKVARRGREHVIYTGRRRMGLSEVRHAIRVMRGGADAARRDVIDLRRDLGHYGAQIGMVLTAGEANREARGEAGAAGQLPVLLLCGEALAEALADAGVGCAPVVVPEVDDGFFRAAAEAAEKEEAARLSRREERERRREREPGREAGREPAEAGEGEVIVAITAETGEAPQAERSTPPRPEDGEREDLPGAAEIPITTDGARDDEDDEGDEEGEEEGSEAAAAGEPGGAPASGAQGEAKEGERRRRRRRRRRRGGRGRGREGGAPAAASAPGGTPGEAAPAGGEQA